MSRKSLSPLQRLKVFEAASGRCHICGARIQLNQPWDVEHVIPLALMGADDPSNMSPAHKACHAAKTAIDFASIAKAKRMKARHLGIRKAPSFQKPPGMKFNWQRGRYEIVP